MTTIPRRNSISYHKNNSSAVLPRASRRLSSGHVLYPSSKKSGNGLLNRWKSCKDLSSGDDNTTTSNSHLERMKEKLYACLSSPVKKNNNVMHNSCPMLDLSFVDLSSLHSTMNNNQNDNYHENHNHKKIQKKKQKGKKIKEILEATEEKLFQKDLKEEKKALLLLHGMDVTGDREPTLASVREDEAILRSRSSEFLYNQACSGRGGGKGKGKRIRKATLSEEKAKPPFSDRKASDGEKNSSSIGGDNVTTTTE